jgi:DeoR family transcriptional regulator, fructose operon transcriptional repressor
MALQIERQLVIRDLIKQQQTVRVDELAEHLGVSANTIRRDLTMLEQQGALKRTQGGAVAREMSATAPPRQSFDLRLSTQTAAKEAIGRRAAQLVQPGSTIILDAGTTTQQVAYHLTTFGRLTIATNSLEAAYALIPYPNLTVILSGGILQNSSRSLIGLPAEQFFAQIHADQVFLATCGISLERGLTNGNFHETPVKQKMIAAAKQVIVLADSAKFGQAALSAFAGLDRIAVVITDEQAPPEMVAQLTRRGIEVLIAG